MVETMLGWEERTGIWDPGFQSWSCHTLAMWPWEVTSALCYGLLVCWGGLDKAELDQTMTTKTQDKAGRQNNSAHPRRVLVMGQIPLKRQLIGKLGQEDGNDLTLALVPWASRPKNTSFILSTKANWFAWERLVLWLWVSSILERAGLPLTSCIFSQKGTASKTSKPSSKALIKQDKFNTHYRIGRNRNSLASSLHSFKFH